MSRAIVNIRISAPLYTGMIAFWVIATFCSGAAATEVQDKIPQPIEILQNNVDLGIAILTDPTYDSPGGRKAQQEALCEIARDMFDTYAFSRLVLAGAWTRFEAEQQSEFVEVFGDFLCRYYLSRLQARYSNETVTFTTQEFKSDTRATVSATVVWREIEIPVEVRMVLRDGNWRAYDLVAAGISAVMLYRAQLKERLSEIDPATLIDELRRRIDEQG